MCTSPQETFSVQCIPFIGVHSRVTRSQHTTCTFLIAAYATLPYALLVQATKYEHSNATPIAFPLHRHPYITCTLRQHDMDTFIEVGWALRAMHQLCKCTSCQKHFSCMVYSVFRCPLPCNPSIAHNMCIPHRRLPNTTLLSACTGHQVRASQCTPFCTSVARVSVYILVH